MIAFLRDVRYAFRSLGRAPAIRARPGLLGVYGVMSDAVLQKKREIAVRLALGAPARAIVAGVFRDGVRIAAAGAALGLIASWVLVQLVVHADSGFHAPPLWTWLSSPVVLLVIVCVASILPARWALAGRSVDGDPRQLKRQTGNRQPPTANRELQTANCKR